jgi:NADP-dependent 3-hydroxy acid dehydrogenase YdfG
MGRLSGRIALVTGASSGIGREIALELARHGAGIILTGRNVSRLSDVSAFCQTYGAETWVVDGDLTDAAFRIRLTQYVQSFPRFPLDILVYAAGCFPPNPAEHDAHQMFTLNVYAPKELCAHLRMARGGDIVFINSSAAISASPSNVIYAATKLAMRSIADSVREENKSVRVMSVFTGKTDTPMQRALYDARGERYNPEEMMAPSDLAQAVVDLVALPCSAEVTEIHIRPTRRRICAHLWSAPLRPDRSVAEN